MTYKKVNLRQEVFRSDVEKITTWVKDENVTEFLNENQDVDKSLNNLLAKSNLPIFTHHFNQNGSFFMVTVSDQEPIGYLKLIPQQDSAEIVIVIGDKKQWGKGFGFKAIWEGLKHAFFHWRKEAVVATIHKQNQRSKKLFKKAGFSKEKDFTNETQFLLTMDDFISSITEIS